MHSKLILGLALTTLLANVANGAITTLSASKDYGGATIGTSCTGDGEGQDPVFLLKNNVTLSNVVIKSGAAGDGVHCEGNCTLSNVKWPDVCEDAATLLAAAGAKTMTISGGSAASAADKVFQHNAIGGTVKISGFTTTGSIGKLGRSCGDCTGNGGPRYFNISTTKLETVTASVVGVNSNYGDKATIRTLQIKGYKSGSPKVCVTYTGVVKGSGSSTSIGEKWNDANCDVKTTDVTSY